MSCYLVPFDEDPKDTDVWFMDHDYLENMAAMFRKVNGWLTVTGFGRAVGVIYRHCLE